MKSRTPEPFDIQCQIRAAEPHVHLMNGQQSDELITHGDNDVRVLRRQRLNERIRSFELLPSHMLAPQHHDALVAGYEKECRKRYKDNEQNPILPYINHITAIPEIRTAVIKELEKVYRKMGPAEQFEDEDRGKVTKLHWLRQKTGYTENTAAYYAMVCKACLRETQKPETKTTFIRALRSELTRECESLSATQEHDGDSVYNSRLRIISKAFTLDGTTGAIRCNADDGFSSAIDSIINERTGWLNSRLTQLRTEMQARYATDTDGPPHDPFSPPLSQNKATQIVTEALRDFIPADVLAHRVLQTALNDRHLTIGVSNHPDHVENITGRSLDDEMRDVNIALCRGELPVVYFSAKPEQHWIAEELAHHALRLIYNNKTEPYVNDNDQRKALLLEHIASDFDRNGEAQAKADFTLEAYTTEELSREIAAKTIAMMATGEWVDMKDRYPAIDSYVRDVIAQDIKTYETQGYVVSYGSQASKLATRNSEQPEQAAGYNRFSS